METNGDKCQMSLRAKKLMAFISPSAKRYLPLTTLTPQEKHLPLSTFNS